MAAGTKIRVCVGKTGRTNRDNGGNGILMELIWVINSCIIEVNMWHAMNKKSRDGNMKMGAERRVAGGKR